MLSCPNPDAGMMHRFQAPQTGSNVSLNSGFSSKDESSSGENSDHNQHSAKTGAFDRNESLQSSFNSDHSLDVSSKESDIGGQRGDDSPAISDDHPFTKSASTFALLSPLEPQNNNHNIEMIELKSGHSTSKSKKKKKVKKSPKTSSASSVGKFLILNRNGESVC